MLQVLQEYVSNPWFHTQQGERQTYEFAQIILGQSQLYAFWLWTVLFVDA